MYCNFHSLVSLTLFEEYLKGDLLSTFGAWLLMLTMEHVCEAKDVFSAVAVAAAATPYLFDCCGGSWEREVGEDPSLG